MPGSAPLPNLAVRYRSGVTFRRMPYPAGGGVSRDAGVGPGDRGKGKRKADRRKVKQEMVLSSSGGMAAEIQHLSAACDATGHLALVSGVTMPRGGGPMVS